MLIAKQIEDEAGMLTDMVSVSSDTSWSCSVEGNFMLDKYDGSGDTIINISALNDIDHTGSGIIVFTYSDNDCVRQTECPVWYIDHNWITVSPNRAYYKQNVVNEYLVFNVKCGDDNWDVVTTRGFHAYKVGSNKVYLITGRSDNPGIEATTSINSDDGTKTVHLTLIS